MAALPRIFLSYASEDRAQVQKIYEKLHDEGYQPWMDKNDLLPGEEWETAIFRSLKQADFVLVFLSPRAYKRGFLQREIRKALYFREERLSADIYLIPVRLEQCEVLEELRLLHYVDLFEKNGWQKLLKAIRVGLKQRQSGAEEVNQHSSGTTSTQDLGNPQTLRQRILRWKADVWAKLKAIIQ